jgi:hypothetical protein
MKLVAGWTLLLFLIAVPAFPRAKQPAQTSWGYVASGPVEVYERTSFKKQPKLLLERGALVAVFETKKHGSKQWAQVLAVDPATLESVQGWLDASRIRTVPLEEFPTDQELLRELGGQYLQDFVAAHTEFARYLIHRSGGKTALVCFLGSAFLPQSRLQVFEPEQGHFRAGGYLEFPFAGLESGVTSIQVLDLAGGECLITHEPFHLLARNDGVNMVIRRIRGQAFQTLWKAPLQYSNLASFPPRMSILEPPEKNIGAPGTVTKATVEFQEHGGARVPVWKGAIEFHIVGRQEPVETRQIEKVCAWTGSAFAPVH